MERLREPESKVFNCDCIDYMRSLPDKYFDLIIADPPYGGGNDEQLGGKKIDFTKEEYSRSITNQQIQRRNMGNTIQATNHAHGGRFARYELEGQKFRSGILRHRRSILMS